MNNRDGIGITSKTNILPSFSRNWGISQKSALV